jgi:hypothetical protein
MKVICCLYIIGLENNILYLGTHFIGYSYFWRLF